MGLSKAESRGLDDYTAHGVEGKVAWDYKRKLLGRIEVKVRDAFDLLLDKRIDVSQHNPDRALLLVRKLLKDGYVRSVLAERGELSLL